MPAENSVLSGPLLVAGLRADFADTYDITYEGVKDSMRDVFDFDVPSDKLTEIFGYFESAPYPRRWDRGEEISSKAFKSVSYTVTATDWARRIPWHVNDRQDDQTQTLFDMAVKAGEHWATLEERVFFQILQGTIDDELLTAIPLAPDGAAVYATTDGSGGIRFGATGGNIRTGTGVASGQTIRTDFLATMARFRLFQDTENQPLWDDRVLDKGFTIYYNASLFEAFQEAFAQGRPVQVIQNVAGTENVATAAVTNIVLDTGVPIRLIPTQRITDNDWYVFLRSAKRKPILSTMRQALREAFATFETSDHTRSTKEEYIQWDSRKGFGVNITYATIKVDN